MAGKTSIGSNQANRTQHKHPKRRNPGNNRANPKQRNPGNNHHRIIGRAMRRPHGIARLKGQACE
ncbi:hypothetical protein GCM10025779_04710 [Arthrobacter cryoconiti]